MKNNKVCSKCSGIDIVRIPGTVGGYGAGNNVNVGSWLISYIKVSRYLCSDCGFSEEWIDSAEDIQKLKKNFKDS